MGAKSAAFSYPPTSRIAVKHIKSSLTDFSHITREKNIFFRPAHSAPSAIKAKYTLDTSIQL